MYSSDDMYQTGRRYEAGEGETADHLIERARGHVAETAAGLKGYGCLIELSTGLYFPPIPGSKEFGVPTFGFNINFTVPETGMPMVSEYLKERGYNQPEKAPELPKL